MTASDDEALAIAVQALEDVVNPLGKIEREMEPRSVLNGGMLVHILKDPYYLQDIAKKALKKIKP